MFADYHVHSEFSWDSRTPMEAQIQAAVRAGVEELCFTEHVDYGARCGEDNCDYSAYKRGAGALPGDLRKSDPAEIWN